MKDNSSYLNLAVLFFSALVLVYFVPSSINMIIFPFYCVLFYRSKSNALWIAFFLLLIEAPGGLFSGGEIMDLLRLPIYNLAAGVSITFEQIFIITALVKAFQKKNSFKPLKFISNSLKSLGIYFVLLILTSFLMGISFDNLRILYRITINLTLFYSIYFLFLDEAEFVSFFKLVFPLSIIAFSLQMYSLVYGHQLITLFKPGILFSQGIIGLYESRPIEMVHIVMIAFFGSLYFLALKKKHFNQTFLLVVNVISFASIFITATRAWTIAFSVSYLLLFLFVPRRMLKITLKNSVALAAAIIFLFSSVLFKNQFSHSFKRISTVELLAKGDITAGGTSDRFDIQAPRVMNAFAKSTILFGAGFSDLYFFEGTGHVGYHNFLLNGGIIGSILLLVFLIKTFESILRMKFLLVRKNPYKDSMLVFFLWLMAILIINGSTQMMGYDIPMARVLLLCLFIYFFSNQAKISLVGSDQRTK